MPVSEQDFDFLEGQVVKLQAQGLAMRAALTALLAEVPATRSRDVESAMQAALRDALTGPLEALGIESQTYQTIDDAAEETLIELMSALPEE